MRRLTLVAITVLSAAGLSPLLANSSRAQVNVNIGVAPDCPYGFYDFAPYNCAPSGYYGPEWFAGGVFVGAGPWFHGPAEFHGKVDNRFDPQHGYHGPAPARGEKPDAARRVDASHFKGNEERDGRGHVAEGRH